MKAEALDTEGELLPKVRTGYIFKIMNIYRRQYGQQK